MVILYASGWRWQSGIGFVRTGGISITIPHEGAVLFLDEEQVGSTGFLNRRFYVNDLIPGTYKIRVEKENYRNWEHSFVVEPQIVTDARAFLVPEKISLLRLIVGTSTATTTRVMDSRTYNSYVAAFSKPFATTTGEAYDISGDEHLFIEKGDVFVRWLNANVSPPSYFCGRPSYCKSEIAIERGKQTATGAAFFGGGVVYRTKGGGVFIGESIILPAAVQASIYSRSGSDFRILDGNLIVKDGRNLYQVTGL